MKYRKYGCAKTNYKIVVWRVEIEGHAEVEGCRKTHFFIEVEFPLITLSRNLLELFTT